MTVTITTARVRSRARRWDQSRGCYVYDISFKTRSLITDRTVKVAEAFGIGIDEEKEHVLYRDFELKLSSGDVVYITGDSGSGKSALLGALADDLRDQAIDISEVEVDPDKTLIDSLGGSFQEALDLLSRVGLNDAFLFLRRYSELSDGQRYRYRVARMVDSGKAFWLADEFCSSLDRSTARIVAFNIQKLARKCGATLVVATAHVDLEEDLNPSVIVRKGWGDEITVEYGCNREAQECTVANDSSIRGGASDEYKRLGGLHYRGGRPPPPIGFYAIYCAGELAGVIVYSHPPMYAAGRRRVLGYAPGVQELNRDWAIVSRVVLHPKFRSAGLGARLVRETLPMVGRRHVELIAVMARYNPFAERAGMRRVAETVPGPSIWAAIEGLRGLGFDPALISSRSYDAGVIGALSGDGLDALRGLLLGVDGVYYRRLRRSYGRVGRGEFREWLGVQGAGSLAGCVATLGVLGQSKVYLYWCRDWLGDGG